MTFDENTYRIVLAYRPARRAGDGILDHRAILAEELRTRPGVQVELADVGPDWAYREPAASVRTADAVVFEYEAFAYGRWGVAPWLVAAMRRVRRRPPGPVVAVVVHELYANEPNVRMPDLGWRWKAIGVWQRLQLEAVRRNADVLCVSVGAWAAELGRRRPPRRVAHLPVGSNLPDMSAHRADGREGLGAAEQTLVVALFGTGHPSQLVTYLPPAINAIADEGHRVIALNLGAGAPALGGIRADVEVVSPGRLDAEPLARLLSAGDLFLGPWVDGASTRRTTLMAALQHRLAVVATDGPLTDPVLREGGALRLVPAGQPERFAALAQELAREGSARRQAAERGHALFERAFTWPVIASALLEALGAARPVVRG